MPSLAAWLASSQARNSACDAKASTGCIARPIVHSKLMSKRLITALVAALALLVAAPAYAQKATATASPGQPPATAAPPRPAARHRRRGRQADLQRLPR